VPRAARTRTSGALLRLPLLLLLLPGCCQNSTRMWLQQPSSSATQHWEKHKDKAKRLSMYLDSASNVLHAALCIMHKAINSTDDSQCNAAAQTHPQFDSTG
jgi:hypothetical protein